MGRPLSPGRLAGPLILLAALAGCSDANPLATRAPTGPALRDEVGSAAFTGLIRIGVVPVATSVTLGAPDAWTVRDRVTGATLLSGTGGTVVVTLESGSTSETRYRLQVMCAGDAAVAARKAQAEAAGHPTYTEAVPSAGCTRLYIGSFPSTASFSVRNTYRNQLIAAGLAATDSFWRLVTIVTGSTAYRVQGSAGTATSPNPVVLTGAGGVVGIAGVRYRGAAEVRRNASGALAGINELPIEQYLYGVVPRELPPTVWDQLEAQKAQAVAARTYALSGLGKRAADGYDLLATTSDQVYGGLDAEHPLSTQAVDETAGVVATYQGALIQALFSSTSGGWSAANEEAFSSAPIAYLRGGPDRERGSSAEHLDPEREIRWHANPRSLRAMRGGDYESDWSRYHRWHFEWSAEEISDVLGAWVGAPVGRVLAINVLERGPSGRVQRIEYVTESGTFYDTKDRIRSSLKFINASGEMSSLLSTLFYVEPVTDRRTGEVTGFQAWGGGWGHGVGLCQTGAAGMAAKKHSYDEILRHYYPGIELTTWY